MLGDLLHSGLHVLLIQSLTRCWLCVLRSQAQHGEATLADALVKSSKASAELALLQADNEQLMQVSMKTEV